MMKIFIFGSSGMLGNYVKNYLKQLQKEVICITRETFDVNKLSFSNIDKLFESLKIHKNDVIINCIGIIPQSNNVNNVTNKNYYKINTLFPIFLNIICNKYHTKLIHITTDCVFSGKKGNYIENDVHDEINDYGVSKSLGELYDKCTIIRTSIIGEEKKNKYSLLEWIKNNKDGSINGYTNHYWNGVTCLQLAKILHEIIDTNNFWQGVRHIYSPTTLSKYELSMIINTTYSLNITINKYETEKYINKSLNTIYYENAVFNIPELQEQIIELKDFTI